MTDLCTSSLFPGARFHKVLCERVQLHKPFVGAIRPVYLSVYNL